MNDTHGHDAGDHALRWISKHIEDVFENDEISCRLGGEEFAILLPNTDLEGAKRFAEILRTGLEEQRATYAGVILPSVTVSIGIAEYPTHGREPQSLLKVADRALYQAKADGRNTVRTAQILEADETSVAAPLTPQSLQKLANS